MHYENLISVVDRLCPSTKGILVLWNKEVEQSGGNRTDRETFFDRTFEHFRSNLYELYLWWLSGDRGRATMGSFFKSGVLAPGAKRMRTRWSPSLAKTLSAFFYIQILKVSRVRTASIQKRKRSTSQYNIMNNVSKRMKTGFSEKTERTHSFVIEIATYTDHRSLRQEQSVRGKLPQASWAQSSIFLSMYPFCLFADTLAATHLHERTPYRFISNGEQYISISFLRGMSYLKYSRPSWQLKLSWNLSL